MRMYDHTPDLRKTLVELAYPIEKQKFFTLRETYLKGGLKKLATNIMDGFYFYTSKNALPRGQLLSLNRKRDKGTVLLSTLLESKMFKGYLVRFSRPYHYPFIFYEFLKFSSRCFVGHTVVPLIPGNCSFLLRSITEEKILGK